MKKFLFFLLFFCVAMLCKADAVVLLEKPTLDSRWVIVDGNFVKDTGRIERVFVEQHPLVYLYNFREVRFPNGATGFRRDDVVPGRDGKGVELLPAIPLKRLFAGVLTGLALAAIVLKGFKRGFKEWELLAIPLLVRILLSLAVICKWDNVFTIAADENGYFEVAKDILNGNIDYIKKLNRLGIKEVKEENFFTSAQAAVMILKEKFQNGLIYAQGTKSFMKGLKAGGLNVTGKYNENAVAVLVSFDTELTAEKLRTTCKMLTKNDIPYYATNPDWVCPVDFGAIPDCGSMCVGIEYATGKKPIFIGKPEPTMIIELMKKFGCDKSEVVVIGDRLYTDIASGVNAGVDTICVLSGEATVEDIQNAKQGDTPTFVLNSVKDLL